MTVFHPHKDDNGNAVRINKPTAPTGPETWFDPSAVAIFTPGSPTPAVLNDVPFTRPAKPLSDSDWRVLGGEVDSETGLAAAHGKKPSAGVVIIEPDGRVWVFEPTNHFGGYPLTFPKGKVDGKHSLAATAAREAFEETGLVVSVRSVLVDVERTTSVARYFVARRVGGTPAQMGWEAQSVRLVPGEQLKSALTSIHDQPILEALARQALSNPP